MGANLLDILIVVFVIFGVVRGVQNGLVRQAFSLGGFVGGLFLGVTIAPYTSRFATNVAMRELIVIATIVGSAVLIGTLVEYAGERLARIVTKLRGEPVDAVLGGGFGAILVLVTVWLASGIFIGTPITSLNQQLATSSIIRALDTHLPAAPTAVARIERLLDPNGFPQVFAGLEPQTKGSTPVASEAQVASAVAAAKTSTVKIQGEGCGGLVSGSGFVAANGLVMTNAHVVAGIRNPTVLDANGRHTAQVVVFDPDLDIAVLRVGDLAGKPLTITAADQRSGTPAVVLGYPGGGDFTAVAAGVIDERFATGRNIYNAGLTDREIYELQTTILPGNSGGPLVAPDGTVVGVVFARSESNTSVGYALVGSQVRAKLTAAQQKTGTVSTGSCAAE